jgi:DNA-directed RNA polymerase subunit RPC12/RpoP
MAARTCPHCKKELSAVNVVAHTNGMDCPNCGARLEVAPGARTLATVCGLGIGAIVWRLSSGSSGDLGAVLPTLYGFLSFGMVSALVLMFTANMRNAPVVAAEPAHSDPGHAAPGHDAGGHGEHH